MRMVTVLTAAIVLASSAAAQVMNNIARGNLEATVDPGCVIVAKASARLSPPHLGLGVLACAKQGDWDTAVELYILMQLRAVFDVQRVSDVSAHQAEDVLSMQVTAALPHGGAERLHEAFSRFGETGSMRQRAFCRTVRAGGPPLHDPSWMIQHGMGAFLDSASDRQVKGFRPKQAWDGLLRDYMKCS